jgi:hypothetical protein
MDRIAAGAADWIAVIFTASREGADDVEVNLLLSAAPLIA